MSQDHARVDPENRAARGVSSPRLPLDADLNEIRPIEDAVVEFINRFLETRSNAPAILPPADSGLIGELLGPPPDEGMSIEELLATYDAAMNTGFDTTSPGFLSYIPTGGLYTSALGSLLGAATNQ